ncbi:MAG: PEP-CTERM sorting domain-containing protein [Thermoguttaceae bacterium]
MLSKKVLFLTALLALFSTISYGQSPPLGGDIGVLRMTVDGFGDALSSLNINNSSVRIGQVQYSTTGSAPWTIGTAQNFQTWLSDGSDGGYWDGVGITSSFAASDSNDYTGINWCTGQEYLDLIGDTFHGVTVNPGDILASYGYYGDCNMDGKVDQLDYNIINSVLAIHPGGTTLAQLNSAYGTHYTALGTIFGDFDYDGYVTSDDKDIMNYVFSKGGKPYGILNPSMNPVPEPSIIVLLGMGAIGLLGNVVLRNKKGHS